MPYQLRRWYYQTLHVFDFAHKRKGRTGARVLSHSLVVFVSPLTSNQAHARKFNPNTGSLLHLQICRKMLGMSSLNIARSNWSLNHIWNERQPKLANQFYSRAGRLSGTELCANYSLRINYPINWAPFSVHESFRNSSRHQQVQFITWRIFANIFRWEGSAFLASLSTVCCWHYDGIACCIWYIRYVQRYVPAWLTVQREFHLRMDYKVWPPELIALRIKES